MACEGSILAVDLAREERNPLVLCAVPVEGGDSKRKKVPGLDELREDPDTVVRGIGSKI